MSFDLDKFIKRPSFYFLATQGTLFLLTAVAANLVALGYYVVENNSIYKMQFFFLFALLCMLPFVILHSFISYSVLAIFRKTSLLFSKGYFFIHFVLFIVVNIFLENPVIFEGDGAGIGLVILGFLCINLITILAPIFVLCPYLVLLFSDKKCANNTSETPFCQSKLYLGAVLFSVAFFIISIVICIYTYFSHSGIFQYLLTLLE